MRLPTANQLQGLTAVQQHVYQIGLTFRNIDEFRKGLVKSGLVWSRTLLTNGESVFEPSPWSWANILNIVVGS